MKKSLCCDAELAKAFFTLERTEHVLAGFLARIQRGYERKEEMNEPKMWEIEVRDVNCQGFEFMRGTNVWVYGSRTSALDHACHLFQGVDRKMIDLFAEDDPTREQRARPGTWTREQVRKMLDREPIIVEPAPTPQPGKSVRIRVAVAVGPDGTWSASSWSGADTDDVKMAIADSMDSETIRWSWVEADVPMPEPEETVQGRVAARKIYQSIKECISTGDIESASKHADEWIKVMKVVEASEDELDREDCDSFEPGEPKGQCDGDGHFLCRRCKEWNKPSPSRDG